MRTEQTIKTERKSLFEKKNKKERKSFSLEVVHCFFVLFCFVFLIHNEFNCSVKCLRDSINILKKNEYKLGTRGIFIVLTTQPAG